MQKVEVLCRKLAAEGTVLLKNEDGLLPLKKATKLAVFGRMQTSYYRSGTGSGGGVFLHKIPCILDSLKSNTDLILDEALIGIYTEWVKENPFDDGGGVWAGEPWFQKEMPVSEEIAQNASKRNDVALIIIGRSAGEDHDNADDKGSYRLTDTEEEMLSTVCKNFENVIVALNTGNIIDLSFVDRYKIKTLMYIWQGGMEGANAFAEILSGRMYPSGKLSDTQCYDLSKHPAQAHFGETDKIIYDDDIYVGYRYFETFQKENVRYPFGFGLTYTDFEVTYNTSFENEFVTVNADVKNIGYTAGKQTVQIYYEAPCGNMGNPSRQLIEFAKTKELEPNETQTLTLRIDVNKMASFDEDGNTGNESCCVLLKGDYKIYAGTDVRGARHVYTYSCEETKVTERLSSALAPFIDFEVVKAEEIDGERQLAHRTVNGRTTDVAVLRNCESLEEIAYTGDKNIKLCDVANGKRSLLEFIAQFNDIELATLVCGEGMSSPKSTPGAAGILGGQTEALSHYGIPICCVADGPSGIKLSKGLSTTLTPNSTMIACSWNLELVYELFCEIGNELKKHEVDALLGPGLNIHKSPLCGRNFEYFSEDPYLSGKIGAYITRGIANSGSYATIKHFCCNNQEKARAEYDVVVSQRALREIYLKPFEIAVKEGKNILVMTSYNSINGYWAASNYDLNATILKKEWKFENIVMTDWWAKCNRTQGAAGNKNALDAMVWSQNDLFMVCEDCLVKSGSILEGLKNGTLSRAELQRSCMNICSWILKTNAYKEYVKRDYNLKYPIVINTDDMATVDSISNVKSDTGYTFNAKSGRNTAFVFEVSVNADLLAQMTVNVKVDESQFSITVNGTNGEKIQIIRFVKTDWWKEHKISLSYPSTVSVNCIDIKQRI